MVSDAWQWDNDYLTIAHLDLAFYWIAYRIKLGGR